MTSNAVNPPSSIAARTAPILGIALMLLGIFFFALNDALGKFLIASYSLGQLLLVRSASALVLLAPFIWREGWRPFREAPRPLVQWLRPLCSTLELGCFYWALAYMPLADVMTYYLAAPIYVTAMSPFLLGERVGWRRWVAVFAGFAGVMIALNPSARSLTPAAFVAIAGSFSFTILMISTRLVRGTSDTVLVTAQMAAALVAGLVLAPFTWVPLTWPGAGLLVVMGIIATISHMCVNRSLKLAPASVVVPYQYTEIVWAIVFGYFVFGDVPRAALLVGAGVIVAAGLYIFIREQVWARPPSFTEPV
jgi:drug/metabolite transporter (DMT)-like permease